MSIRYYLVLIISIFLSLGIGIFIGFTIEGDKIIEQQQAQMTKRIEQKFQELKDKNDILSDKIEEINRENSMFETFNRAMFSEIAKDKLVNKQISILNLLGDIPYDYTGLTKMIHESGGSINRDINLNIHEFEGFSSRLTSSDNSDAQVNMIKDTAVSLLNYLIVDQKNQLIDGLMDQGIIDIKQSNENTTHYLLITCTDNTNNNGYINQLQREIIQQVKAFDVSIIALEHEKVTSTSLELYKKNKIPTIDNINTVSGQLSLIAVLGGEYGHFGTKPVSDKLLPDTLMEKD
ncbi:MAG: copper transporter [Mahellales bacterium]|jgi:hypothetical protein